MVYNGVDAALFRPGDRGEARRRLGLDPDRTALLYVGNLLPVKGGDVLIDACARLLARGADFDLHVVGKGPLRPELERMAREKGLGERTRFHGVIPHDQLPDWFRAASALILPSRSEGVPNVLLEAAACGTPFVATAVGGVPEVAHLGDSRLAPPEDPVGLADGIEELISRPPSGSGGASVGRGHTDAARELVAVFAAALGRQSASVRYFVQYRVGEGEMTSRAGSRFRQIMRWGLATALPRRAFITSGPRGSGAVCLTFDDGPHPVLTPQLLDLLAEHKVPATFFLIGQEAEKYPDVVRRMTAEGHAIGNHSYSHPARELLSGRQAADEVARGSEVLAAILGASPTLYRPPRGKVTAGDLWRLRRLGLTTVLWNVDPKDYAKKTPGEVRDWFGARPLRAGDLVLLHDIHPHAAEVLPDLIAATRGRGLRFTTVAEWTT